MIQLLTHKNRLLRSDTKVCDICSVVVYNGAKYCECEVAVGYINWNQKDVLVLPILSKSK